MNRINQLTYNRTLLGIRRTGYASSCLLSNPRLYSSSTLLLTSKSAIDHVFGSGVSVTVGDDSKMIFSEVNTMAIGGLSLANAVCRHGDTVVHTVVNVKSNFEAKEDFLPLTVDYRYRSYSSGLFPQKTTRRDRHGNEEEILIARVIDRAIRPLFGKGYVNEVQVIATAHALDQQHDPLIASVNATSLALLKSGLPWNGPVGCVRVGLIDGKLVVNPTIAAMKTSSLDFVYAGTHDRPLMIEAIGDQIPEQVINEAMDLAQLEVKKIVNVQRKMMPLESEQADSYNTSEIVEAVVQHKSFTGALNNFIQNALNTTVGNLTNNFNGIQKAVEVYTAPGHSENQRRLAESQLVESMREYVRSHSTYKLPPMQVDAIIQEILEVGKRRSADQLRSESQNRSNKLKKVFKVPIDLVDYLNDKHNALPRAFAIYTSNEKSKEKRGQAEGSLIGELKAAAKEPMWSHLHPVEISMAVDEIMTKGFRNAVLAMKSTAVERIDGREKRDAVRPLWAGVECLPVVHGSSYFQRGETHVLSTTTLGSLDDAKVTTAITGGPELKKNFFLHYDFPPYATGVLDSATVINRRMVGHGNLAEKGVRPVMPSVDEFPYTVSVFSECTSSNGSSSMASVCGASLSLMDAGVPIKAPVAGISIGLVTDDSVAVVLGNRNEHSGKEVIPPNKYTLLTDILGTEDHYGDMDFKIAGTSNGVTAIQLDIKLEGGIPLHVLQEALVMASGARQQVLRVMNETLAAPRLDTKPNAPRAEIVKFDPSRKRHLLGVGGEMLNFIKNTYNCIVDVNTDGVAYLFGADKHQVLEAKILVQDLVSFPQEGDLFTSEVVEIMDFGLQVKLTRAQRALLHISELSHDPELLRKNLKDVVKIGQKIDVKVLNVDVGTGQIKVSRRAVLDNNSLPDNLSPEQATSAPIGSLPEFPVIPPRRYNLEFFKQRKVTDEEIEEAVVRQRAKGNDKNAPSHNLEAAKSRGSHSPAGPQLTKTVKPTVDIVTHTKEPKPTKVVPFAAPSTPGSDVPPKSKQDPLHDKNRIEDNRSGNRTRDAPLSVSRSLTDNANAEMKSGTNVVKVPSAVPKVNEARKSEPTKDSAPVLAPVAVASSAPASASVPAATVPEQVPVAAPVRDSTHVPAAPVSVQDSVRVSAAAPMPASSPPPAQILKTAVLSDPEPDRFGSLETKISSLLETSQRKSDALPAQTAHIAASEPSILARQEPSNTNELDPRADRASVQNGFNGGNTSPVPKGTTAGETSRADSASVPPAPERHPVPESKQQKSQQEIAVPSAKTAENVTESTSERFTKESVIPSMTDIVERKEDHLAPVNTDAEVKSAAKLELPRHSSVQQKVSEPAPAIKPATIAAAKILEDIIKKRASRQSAAQQATTHRPTVQVADEVSTSVPLSQTKPDTVAAPANATTTKVPAIQVEKMFERKSDISEPISNKKSIPDTIVDKVTGDKAASESDISPTPNKTTIAESLIQKYRSNVDPKVSRNSIEAAVNSLKKKIMDRRKPLSKSVMNKTSLPAIDAPDQLSSVDLKDKPSEPKEVLNGVDVTPMEVTAVSTAPGFVSITNKGLETLIVPSVGDAAIAVPAKGREATVEPEALLALAQRELPKVPAVTTSDNSATSFTSTLEDSTPSFNRDVVDTSSQEKTPAVSFLDIFSRVRQRNIKSKEQSNVIERVASPTEPPLAIGANINTPLESAVSTDAIPVTTVSSDEKAGLNVEPVTPSESAAVPDTQMIVTTGEAVLPSDSLGNNAERIQADGAASPTLASLENKRAPKSKVDPQMAASPILEPSKKKRTRKSKVDKPAVVVVSDEALTTEVAVAAEVASVEIPPTKQKAVRPRKTKLRAAAALPPVEGDENAESTAASSDKPPGTDKVAVSSPVVSAVAAFESEDELLESLGEKGITLGPLLPPQINDTDSESEEDSRNEVDEDDNEAGDWDEDDDNHRRSRRSSNGEDSRFLDEMLKAIEKSGIEDAKAVRSQEKSKLPLSMRDIDFSAAVYKDDVVVNNDIGSNSDSVQSSGSVSDGVPQGVTLIPTQTAVVGEVNEMNSVSKGESIALVSDDAIVSAAGQEVTTEVDKKVVPDKDDSDDDVVVGNGFRVLFKGKDV